jgi:hypothetical protein
MRQVDELSCLTIPFKNRERLFQPADLFSSNYLTVFAERNKYAILHTASKVLRDMPCALSVLKGLIGIGDSEPVGKFGKLCSHESREE